MPGRWKHARSVHPMKDAVAPRRPFGASPLRRPGSIRRTSSIDTSWPQGKSGPLHLQGEARDLMTPFGSSVPRVLACDRIDVMASPMREILEISSDPERAEVAELVGQRAGFHLRAAIDDLLPNERDAGSPLYLLLDDLSGATLVAGWAWSRWDENWMERGPRDGSRSSPRRKMEGICIGFAAVSSALLPDGTASPQQSSCPVPPLQHPDDRQGWHRLPVQEGVGMRRARRIDVWREDGLICVDAGFQDSATSPSGGRVAIHEYALGARADRTGKLVSIDADPRVLPYAECPGAVANIGRLIGEPLGSLRKAVLGALRGDAGCTHLNDAMRAFAEVPQLVAKSDAALAGS